MKSIKFLVLTVTTFLFLPFLAQADETIKLQELKGRCMKALKGYEFKPSSLMYLRSPEEKENIEKYWTHKNRFSKTFKKKKVSHHCLLKGKKRIHDNEILNLILEVDRVLKISKIEKIAHKDKENNYNIKLHFDDPYFDSIDCSDFNDQETKNTKELERALSVNFSLISQ